MNFFQENLSKLGYDQGMIVILIHLAFGFLTSLFLLKGYESKTYKVKNITLGHDKGSFLKLYSMPYEKFKIHFPNPLWMFLFRISFPMFLGGVLWLFGAGIMFWIIPIGSLSGELIYLYKEKGRNRILQLLKSPFTKIS